MKTFPKVLIFSPSSSGGIAEHTYYQAKALGKAKAKVTCLVPPSFLSGRRTDFKTIPCLPDPVEGPPGFAKKLRMAWQIVASRYVLAWQIIKLRPDLVLLDSYTEYLAPLWIDPHIILSRIFGVCYAANLHDPVRNYAIGPIWLHRLSVWLAYQPLDFVLVHDRLPKPSPVPKRVKVVHVPVGLYDIMNHPFDQVRLRRDWGVQDNQKIFLSFGYVRDGKNLDLVLQALKQNPSAFLVVAGSVASSKDKPFDYYRELSSRLRVHQRCHFIEGFISDRDLAEYFAVTDFVLLTYSAKFHSQSGVLCVAARARKPVLASAAPSPLMDVVRKFQLGLALEPDSLNAISDGMQRLISETLHPLWDDFEEYASWDRNAKGILDAAEFSVPEMPSDQI